jgi:hypothetical protein
VTGPRRAPAVARRVAGKAPQPRRAAPSGRARTGRRSAGEVAPDPKRIMAGWEPRFVADRARAEEAIRLYRDLGFEVVADLIEPDDLSPDCGDCGLAMALRFRMIYTRRPPPAVAKVAARSRPRRGGTDG